MKNVIIKLINFFKKNQKKLTSDDQTSNHLNYNHSKSDEMIDNSKFDEEMKYFFPSSDINFKNFATDKQNYSTIIFHHENLIKSIKSFLKNENLDKTKYFLETMKNFYEKTSNFYLDLFSLDNILMSELNNKISKDINTLLSFAVWGEKYAEKFCLLTLASIMEDVIEINKEYKIQIVVFADESANSILINNSIFIELKQLGIIKIIVIPNRIFQLDYYLEKIAFTRYYVFGFIQNICWRFCATNSINLSLLTPDNFYSKDFFKSLVEKINKNNNLYAIFSNSSLKVQIDESENIKEIASNLIKMNLDDLFKFFKNNIHHSFYDYFIQEDKKIENNSSMYILNSKEKLFIYSAHSHPYILSKEYLKKFKNFITFLPIDESFPIQDNNDINFFEKKLNLNDGICLDLAEHEDMKKNMINYSDKNIHENYLRFKDNKLNMWIIKNPVKLDHKENSDLTFNILDNNEKTKKTFNLDLNSDLNIKFEQIIKKI